MSWARRPNDEGTKPKKVEEKPSSKTRYDTSHPNRKIDVDHDRKIVWLMDTTSGIETVITHRHIGQPHPLAPLVSLPEVVAELEALIPRT